MQTQNELSPLARHTLALQRWEDAQRRRAEQAEEAARAAALRVRRRWEEARRLIAALLIEAEHEAEVGLGETTADIEGAAALAEEDAANEATYEPAPEPAPPPWWELGGRAPATGTRHEDDWPFEPDPLGGDVGGQPPPHPPAPAEPPVPDYGSPALPVDPGPPANGRARKRGRKGG